MKVKVILFLILIVFIGTINAITLNQTTDIPDTLYIGIPFYIHLTVPQGADSLHVVIPDSLPNFQILEQRRSAEKGKNEFIIKSAAFETGNLQFPALRVDVYRKTAIDSTAISPFNLTVLSVLPPKEEPKLKDIAGPLNIPWTIWNYIVILVTVIVLGAIIYLFVRYLKRRKVTDVPMAKPMDIRPAWLIALEALEELQLKRLLDEGDFLNYHFELSMILRRFLENYIRFNAVEMTTSEIHDILQARDFLRWVGIMEFLESADTVKFAKHIPAREQSESAYRWLYLYLKSFSEMNKEPEKENSNA